MLRQVPSITWLLFDWFFSFYFRARVSLGSLGWPCTHILLSSLWGQRLQACTPKPASDCSSDFWVLTWLRLTSALFQFQSGHGIWTKMPQVQVCLFFFFFNHFWHTLSVCGKIVIYPDNVVIVRWMFSSWEQQKHFSIYCYYVFHFLCILVTA